MDRPGGALGRPFGPAGRDHETNLAPSVSVFHRDTGVPDVTPGQRFTQERPSK